MSSSIIGTPGNDSLTGGQDIGAVAGDVLSGLAGNDTLSAGGAQQTLLGGVGDDLLIGSTRTTAMGGDGQDRLEGVYLGYGDNGNDTLIGGGLSGGTFGAQLFGGDGDDNIVGTDKDDSVSGGGGANTIAMGAGDDIFYAFERNPHDGGGVTIFYNGDPGNNIIDGGVGVDELRFSVFIGNNEPVEARVVVDLAAGTASSVAFAHNYFGNISNISGGSYAFTSIENVQAGRGDDSINGSSIANQLTGGKGADTIFGGDGNDTINGDGDVSGISDAPNLLRGEGGNDVVNGGSAADTIEGGAGADTIDGREGADTVLGGDGDDRLDGGNGVDVLTGGAGSDTFAFLATDLDAHQAHADTITDWSSSDRISIMYDAPIGYVERTASTYDAAYAAATAAIQTTNLNYVAVQVGPDVVFFSNVSNGQFEQSKILDNAVILSGRTLSDISAANIIGAIDMDGGSNPPTTPQQPASGTLTFNTIVPSVALSVSATDKIAFTSGTATEASVLYGADTVTIQMGGTSVVFGTAISAISKAGNITLPDGSDFYIGLGDNDVFIGKATGDAAFGGLGDDTLDGGQGGDLLQGNQGRDQLLGGEGNDTIYGGQDADLLGMGSGSNFGQGNRGEDSIAGGEGVDTLLGGQDNDTVQGDAGNDFLNGNRGDDSIMGGTGNDTLYGEGGTDTLAGGTGADVFHAFAGQEIDRITDFSRAEGDRIVLNMGMTHSEAQVGSDVVVGLGGGDQFVLVGVQLASLTGDWIGL